MASGGLLVMAPAIIGTFFWKRGTAAGALMSILLPSSVLFVAVSLFTKAPAGASAYVDQVERDLEEKGFRSGKRRPQGERTAGTAARSGTLTRMGMRTADIRFFPERCPPPTCFPENVPF